MDQRYRNPRIWSNNELKQIANLFTGDVVNVSAGDDVDKQGSNYSQYFSNASSYTNTNYGGATYRGFQCRPNEIELDLTANLPGDLKGKFDVVFNHTTLEHIFDVHKAFHNLCELSHDVVILVVPFCQIQHETEGYLDYWRFTPTCIRQLFQNEGFEVIYEAANDAFNTSVYLFFVVSKFPQKWNGQLPSYKSIDIAGKWVGQELSVAVVWQLLVKALISLTMVNLRKALQKTQSRLMSYLNPVRQGNFTTEKGTTEKGIDKYTGILSVKVKKSYSVSVLRRFQNLHLRSISDRLNVKSVLNVGSVPEDSDKEGTLYLNYFQCSAAEYYTLDKNRSSSDTRHFQCDLHDVKDICEHGFDLILCMSTLEHTENPTKVVEQISRITNPNGYLYLVVPWFYPLHKDPQGRYGDYWRFNDESLRLLLSGWKEIWIKGIPSVISEVEDRDMYWRDRNLSASGYCALFQKLD